MGMTISLHFALNYNVIGHHRSNIGPRILIKKGSIIFRVDGNFPPTLKIIEPINQNSF